MLGRIALMQPVLVNTSKLIYQVNAATVDGVLQVYDGGLLDKISGDYSDLTDLYNNAPASGSWRQLPGSGLFRAGLATGRTNQLQRGRVMGLSGLHGGGPVRAHPDRDGLHQRRLGGRRISPY